MKAVFNREMYDLPRLLFEQLAVARGYAFWRHSKWRTETAHLDGLRDIAFRETDSDGERSVRLDRADALAFLSLDTHGHVEIAIAAAGEAALIALLDEVRGALPAATDQADDEIAVRFWTAGSHRADSVVRRVAAEPWAAIRANYESSVADAMDALVARREPPPGGQLVLWHGPPGTGKTHAIRALISAWRSWIVAEYVVDPETFFGAGARYLMEVLLGDDDEVDSSKWRLLIFEDTGELLSADAKERVGQGLSRLLNTVDGLLGQGLKVLALITTNEDLGRLHPAVTRPGRCAVNLRFGPLDRETALRWAELHGVSLPPELQQPILADLFALESNADFRPARRDPIGFQATAR